MMKHKKCLISLRNEMTLSDSVSRKYFSSLNLNSNVFRILVRLGSERFFHVLGKETNKEAFQQNWCCKKVVLTSNNYTSRSCLLLALVVHSDGTMGLVKHT